MKLLKDVLKCILEFLDNFLGYILVIPALVLILMFSLVPIVQSLRYSFFDLQLNDQQKNDMYLSEHYNITLANEDIFYIEYYLQQEANASENESTKAYIAGFITEMKQDYQAILKKTGNTEGIIKISQEQFSEIDAFNQSLQAEVEAIYALTGENYSLQEDTLAVADDFDKTLITSNFIGFDNFTRAIKDGRMWSTMGITLIFTFFSVFFELIIGLFLALVMNKAIKGRGFIRTTSLIPWAIPTSVAALMWLYMYNGDSGIFAMILTKLNIIDSPSVLLGTGKTALISIILSDIWKTTPYMALMLLAGLQVIPYELYESSSIDGANVRQQFLKITLPLLKPSIMVALLFRTLDAFRVFDLIYVLTSGGPGGQTESISIYSYKVLKSQTVLGYGSTLVIFMAVVVGIISFLYIKVLGVKVAKEM